MTKTGNGLTHHGKMERFRVLSGRSLASDLVRAEPIESALHPRTIGRADAVAGPSWRVVYIRRGSVEILSGDSRTALTGPAVAWLPWRDDLRLRVAAGTVGVHILVGQAAVTNAIGYKSESADIRMAAEHPIHLALFADPGAEDMVAQSVNGIFREVHENAVSSMTVIEALLRILLITLWRGQGTPVSQKDAAPPAQRLMARFNALLEAHFRERWTVAAFADRLGVSADRLTDTCRRTRGRAPKDIIDDRITTEAKLLLENSTQSIDEIASTLGFTASPHFNRFFRRRTGTPPGRHRKAAWRTETAGNSGDTALHEWP